MALVEIWFLAFREHNFPFSTAWPMFFRLCGHVAYHLLLKGCLVLERSTDFPADVDAGAGGSHIHTNILRPQYPLHFDPLELQIGDAPYPCGQHLTTTDIMMSFPLEISLAKCVVSQDDYSLIATYLQRMYQRPAIVRAM